MLFPEKRLGLTSSDEGGEPLGDPFGLIIPAVPSAGGVQRDGDED